jgi:Uma2 family endonuclease
MGTIAKPITFEESLLLPEDKCEEIIEGVSRRMPPASYNHADAIKRIFKLWESLLDPNVWNVQAFGSGQLIRRRPLTYRVPDIAVYRGPEIRAEHYVTSVPELIIEVISPANRKGDLHELLKHYAEIGVPEVWFVALDRRELVRFRLESGAYREFARLTAGSLDVLGVTIPLHEIWGGDS